MKDGQAFHAIVEFCWCWLLVMCWVQPESKYHTSLFSLVMVLVLVVVVLSAVSTFELCSFFL
jgi:hypothetical protein